MNEKFKMNKELYARIVRGVLHSEPSVEEREPSKTYEMIEKLKQAVSFDENGHQKVLSENENCVEYWMNIKISCPQTRKFLLQVARSSSRFNITKEQALETNSDYFIAISNNRNYTIRFFNFDESRSAPTSGDERERPCQRSSSFLKRWVRTSGKSHPCAHMKVSDMILSHPITKHLDGVEDTRVTMVLKRRLVSGRDFDPIMTNELLELIRCLYIEQFCTEKSEDEVSLDLTKSIIRRIARFYSIPMTQIRLLSVGVALEQERSHSNFEATSEVLSRNIPKLKTASLVKDPLAVEAALFLSEQIIHYICKITNRQNSALFLPIQCETSTVFFAYCHYLSPVLDLCSLNVWEKAEVSHLKESVKQIFQSTIRISISHWLNVFDSQNEDPNFICKKIDELHICLRRFSKNYDEFFEKGFFKYSEFVVSVVDEHIMEVVDNLLKKMVTELDSRNKQKMNSFTKSTMQLFDALRQFVEYFSTLTSIKFKIHNFESLFETSAVFWASTWRTMYLNLVKKSVEIAEETICGAPSSPVEEKGNFFFSTSFTVASKVNKETEMHSSTVNTIALCSTLCEDFKRLNVQTSTTMLVCSLQIVNTLADCLKSFAVLLRNQLYINPSLGKMIRAANGIEYAATYIEKHFERFLNLKKLYKVLQDKDKSRIQTVVNRIIRTAVDHCHGIAYEIIDCICAHKTGCIKKHAEIMAMSNDNYKKTLKSYMKQFITSEKTDQIYISIEKCITVLKPRLLPNCYQHLERQIWSETRDCIYKLILNGQPPDYYENIEKECESLCNLLSIDWNSENSLLRRKIHINKAETRELILQYYSRLADLTMESPVKDGIPRVSIRAGHIPLHNQMIKLVIRVISAYDIPPLDRMTHSSDPYLRVELYPRAFFPFSMFPPETTDTKKKTLNPQWDMLFQMEIPEEYFFTNGSCLCLTVLDHDHLSYNDLAGQAMIPLSTIERIQSLSPKHLPPPMVLPLALPQSAQYTDVFKILEDRSTWDPMAHEVTSYEKYLRDYRVLPSSAMDDKECGAIHSRLTLAKNREKMKQVIKNFIKK